MHKYRGHNKGYQAQNKGYRRHNKGYPAQNKGYRGHNKGYQAQNKGYQVPNRGYQAQNKGYQISKVGYSFKSGKKNERGVLGHAQRKSFNRFQRKMPYRRRYKKKVKKLFLIKNYFNYKKSRALIFIDRAKVYRDAPFCISSVIKVKKKLLYLN